MACASAACAGVRLPAVPTQPSVGAAMPTGVYACMIVFLCDTFSAISYNHAVSVFPLRFPTELEDDRTLSEHIIQKETTALLGLRDDGRTLFDYVIQKKSITHVTLDIEIFDIIDNVKGRLQDIQDIPPDHPRMTLVGKQLKYILHMVRYPRGGPQIYVRTLVCSSGQLEDDRTFSAYDTQKEPTLLLVLRLSGGMPIFMILVGKQLKDVHMLLKYDIQKETSLHLMLRLRAGIQMYLQTLAGKTNILEIEASDVFNSAQAQTQDNEGFMTVWQRLILASRQFEAGRNPSDYDTQKELSLYLVFRLFEGMPLIVKTLPGKMITSDVKISDMIRVDPYIPPMLIGYHGAVVPKDMNAETLAIPIPDRTM